MNRWITDDGFIYMRVVQQIRAGNGPVFNNGERVEAFTGTVWVALLAVADLYTVRLEWIAVFLGLGAGAGLGLAMAGNRFAFDDRWFVPLRCGCLRRPHAGVGVGHERPGDEAWCSAGWALPVAAGVVVPQPCLPGRRGARARGGGRVRSLACSAASSRSSGGRWRQNGRRRRVALIAAAVALPVAYQVFRMGYFGSVVEHRCGEGGG